MRKEEWNYMQRKYGELMRYVKYLEDNMNSLRRLVRDLQSDITYQEDEKPRRAKRGGEKNE